MAELCTRLNEDHGLQVGSSTLAAILASSPKCEIAETVRANLARANQQLLTFLDFRGLVEITDNGCACALRPAVIQRKVTDGFRSKWATQGNCAVRTVVDTQKLNGKSSFPAIRTIIPRKLGNKITEGERERLRITNLLGISKV